MDEQEFFCVVKFSRTLEEWVFVGVYQEKAQAESASHFELWEHPHIFPRQSQKAIRDLLNLNNISFQWFDYDLWRWANNRT